MDYYFTKVKSKASSLLSPNALRNNVITLDTKVFLNALRNNVITLDTKVFLNALKTAKKAYIISSLEYLKAIRFNYYYFKGKKNNKGYTTDTRSCCIIDNYSTIKVV